jgi:hypothetical protein
MGYLPCIWYIVQIAYGARKGDAPGLLPAPSASEVPAHDIRNQRQSIRTRSPQECRTRARRVF